jgi:hypothetical protein
MGRDGVIENSIAIGRQSVKTTHQKIDEERPRRKKKSERENEYRLIA